MDKTEERLERMKETAPDMYKLLRLFHDNVSTAITIHHIITFVNAFDVECRKLLARIDGAHDDE